MPRTISTAPAIKKNKEVAPTETKVEKEQISANLPLPVSMSHTSFAPTHHHWLGKIASDMYKLFYPAACAGCGKVLVKGEDVICLHCRQRLPQTNFHNLPGNRMEKHFWGKVEFERAAAFVHFHKNSGVQRMLHMLKYKGRRDVGYYLGRMYGAELKSTNPFSEADMVIPVPLHPSKQRRRGYNQAETIARGLADELDIPCRTDLLLRTANTETQTHKNRLQRWVNVGKIFVCTDSELITGKRVILVDDVITTGSTLEACAVALQKNAKDVKIDFITAAFASS